MTKLQPLKSSIGQPAEGKQKYYNRKDIIKKIRWKLDNGENILISAPRRMGKSSILKYIASHPKENQIIKYLSIQAVDSNEQFFKKIYNELISDSCIFEGVDGYIKRTGAAVKNYFSRLRGVSIEGGIKIDEKEAIDYFQECINLMRCFENKNVIIFIDEFPDALNNILKKDKEKAIQFLQQNRDMRLEFSDTNLQFVYTGSTGLRNIVKKMHELHLINDIEEVIIPPFSKKEAKELIDRLVLGYQEYDKSFTLTDEAIDYIFKKITWFLPYYLQIIVGRLSEYHEEQNNPKQPITLSTIDLILDNMVKTRSGTADYFENWKDRLNRSFVDKDYTLSLGILNHIAKNNTISSKQISDLATVYDVENHNYVTSILEYDGYISENKKQYGFNSFLLKEWWYLNVAV